MDDFKANKKDLNQFYWNATLIHHEKDEWGDIIITQEENCRILSFEGVYEQSRQCIDNPTLLTHDYTQSMLLVLAFIKPKHITILGLGGGCLVRALHELLNKTKIEAVELRQAVLDVTKKYFGLPETPLINIHIIDAKQYIKKQAQAVTDIIFADMYHAYEMESFQQQKRFLNDSYHMLTTNGWLVINFHKMPDVNSIFFDRLNTLFEVVLICPVPYGNYILFAGKSSLKTDIGSHLLKLKPYQDKMPIRFDLLFKRIMVSEQFQTQNITTCEL